ncbi:PGC-1 and ERR-induced regulator in muscle protein 1 isoform X2 [Labeo rohita]|uniref:PGC-1 and ERR-induced regulator in muscle protein 1 isoform X2 n=1 Tax=Labeo rohita TaxID=84645 RepID=UPI0021E31720|nr:PGC-1 and ERR-induced regulator in muscle protein 1 isoform X2 [Labeo rohita]
MDDFEYSVHISDQDWDCFFQECEDCNLLSPGLASREDSGMSDIDEMGCLFRSRNPAMGTASTDPDPDLQIDGPPDCEGSPVGNYLSKYGIRSPEQVLSGSEEDLHLQTVNLFFEQLKSVTENQQPLEQSHVVIRGNEKMGHLEGLIDKQDILSVDTGPSGRNKPSLRGEITKKGVANTWSDKASVKALGITSANAQEHASKSDTELVIGRKPLTTPLITVRMKQEQQGRYNGLSKNLELTPETKPPDKEKMVVVIKKDMTDTYPARQNIAQLDAISSSDSRDSPFGQIPVSPSRRKRRKKKRMSVEPLEQGHEAQIHIRQSESEEERFIQRKEISNFPANVWKTEHLSLQRIKTPSIVHNTDHLQLRNTFDLEADFKFSKSLPVSFISDLGATLPKPEVGHISFNTISKSMHDTSLVNNGQLKAKICELSLLPQTDKVLNIKENEIDITESLQCDPAVHLRESRTDIKETLSAPLSDNSDAGCQRKSLLSPSVSSAVDLTEPPSFTVSFKLTEDKDLSCLGNETDCSPIKNERTVPSSCNIVEISATKESSLSLTDNIDRAESCSDGNSAEIFICSLEDSQKQEACVHENISESQITKESSLYLTDNTDRAESCSDGNSQEPFTCSQEVSQKPKACIHEKISESQITKECSLSLLDKIDRAESCSDGNSPKTSTCSLEVSQKPKACIHEKISESQITKESSLFLLDKIDRAESCWNGKDPETLTCSREASRKPKACIPENISESQSHLTSQVIEINTNIPVNETDAMTESHMSDNIDHGTDEDHIQSRNETSEVLIVNATPLKTGNSDESDDMRDISDNEVVVSASEQLFCGKPFRSSEDTYGPTEEMLSEGPTQDVSELPQNMVDEIEDSSSAECKSEGNDLESVSLDASNQLPCPVFAISSFWNEMEKLTINDILRLRLISNAQHPSILTQPEDGSIVDTTDAADSGYFTQPDDSKPDRLSGDMSYISDLDEDLAQLQTPFPSKQEDELSEWASRVPSSCDVMWENDSDPVVVGDEVVHISSETALPEHLYTANAQQCFRRMCKNMSVQNLQALDTQPIRQILRNASMHSIHSEVDDDLMDPFYHLNTSGSKIFSDDEEEMESSGVTVSEIIQFFFGEDEPERCPSRGDNIAASYLDGTGTSLPETYDHFFSEFDAIVEESGGDKMVPIFSCSRSTNRNLQFPEAYDYFFPDSPGSSDEDDENDNAAVKVVTRYDYKSPNHDAVDMYEHFFSEDESDFLWTSPVSLRKVRRTGFTVPEEKTCSGELVPVKTFPKGIIQPKNAMSPDGSPFPDSLLFNMENRIFQQLAEQQKKCMEMQTAVADPRLDAPFLPLKQADMCLVCIAFASWVLKSTGSGGDTWKAALLANVSALSAIRYLRRHKREEVSGKIPLRQIEPA